MKILTLLQKQPDDFKYLLNLDPSAPIFKALENLRQTVDNKNILFILKDICSKQMPIEKAENLIDALSATSLSLNKMPEASWMLQTIVNTINNKRFASIGIVKEKNQPFDIIDYLMSPLLLHPFFADEENTLYYVLYPWHRNILR